MITPAELAQKIAHVMEYEHADALTMLQALQIISAEFHSAIVEVAAEIEADGK